MWDLILYGRELFSPAHNLFLGPPSSGDDDGAERGLLHTWKGYSCSVTPERLLLPRPVLQVALGSRHGVLLVEGNAGFSSSSVFLGWGQVAVLRVASELTLTFS